MILKGLHGTKYELDSTLIGSGGEGDVYGIVGADHVAKVYKSGTISKELENKLQFMVEHPPDESVFSQVAWPLALVYKGKGQCVGFIMPRLNINAELGDIYKYPPTVSISMRQKINIAQNICVVISEVHKAGYVFGDFNPRNIGLDIETGLVSFLDTDTYHVIDKAKNRVFRCNVCAPGYAAPELLKKCSDFVAENPSASKNAYAQTPLPTFDKDTDKFALAIHIFKILMNGYTPFGGIMDTSSVSQSSPGVGDAAVLRDNYCFKPGYKHQSVAIMPLEALPQEIADLFTRAFILGKTDPRQRPDAVEWHSALVRYEQNLKTCYNNSLHQYDASNSECPLCAADRRFEEILEEKTHSDYSLRQSPYSPPLQEIPSSQMWETQSSQAPQSTQQWETQSAPQWGTQSTQQWETQSTWSTQPGRSAQPRNQGSQRAGKQSSGRQNAAHNNRLSQGAISAIVASFWVVFISAVIVLMWTINGLNPLTNPDNNESDTDQSEPSSQQIAGNTSSESASNNIDSIAPDNMRGSTLNNTDDETADNTNNSEHNNANEPIRRTTATDNAFKSTTENASESYPTFEDDSDLLEEPSNQPIVLVPSLIGMNYDEARQKLEDCGLKIGDVFDLDHEPINIVTRQSPASENVIYQGDAVDLWFEPIPPEAELYMVIPTSVGFLRLREEPSTSSAELQRLLIGEVLARNRYREQLYSKEGLYSSADDDYPWYYVFNTKAGGVGWVYSRYVERVYKYYLVIPLPSGSVNLRREPSSSSIILCEVPSGETLEFLYELSGTPNGGSNWYKVRYRKYGGAVTVGWVDNAYIKGIQTYTPGSVSALPSDPDMALPSDPDTTLQSEYDTALISGSASELPSDYYIAFRTELLPDIDSVSNNIAEMLGESTTPATESTDGYGLTNRTEPTNKTELNTVANPTSRTNSYSSGRSQASEQPTNSSATGLPTTHKVISGETLEKIAYRYYRSISHFDLEDLWFYVDLIKRANGLHSDVIHVGEILIIPHPDADLPELPAQVRALSQTDIIDYQAANNGSQRTDSADRVTETLWLKIPSDKEKGDFEGSINVSVEATPSDTGITSRIFNRSISLYMFPIEVAFSVPLNGSTLICVYYNDVLMQKKTYVLD